MNLNDIVLNYLTDNEKGMQQLITWFLNDVMNEEVAQQAGVPKHARSSSRRAHRNGYRSRSLKTRFGDLMLQKPQLREIPFETKVFERYSRAEKALVNAIIESYLQGVSTRNVEKVISHLGVTQISASYVSKVAQELDVKITEFMERTIDSHFPYLFVDASYFKVRDGVKYINEDSSRSQPGYGKTDTGRSSELVSLMRNMNLPGKEYFPTSRIVVSVRWISLFQMDIPGSNRLPKGCSLAHHGSFVTFILSGQF